MANIISFSLYGTNPLYTLGAIENARLCKQIYPDWETLFYVHPTVPTSVIDSLRLFDARVIIVDREYTDERELIAKCTFWRFLAVHEQQAKYVIFRDCDSRVSDKEAGCVKQWLESGTDFHMIYDHPYHTIEILAGMWGARASSLANMSADIDSYCKTLDKKYIFDRFYDQHFLREVIWNQYIKQGQYIAHGDEDICKFHRERGIKITPFPENLGFSLSGSQKQIHIGQTILCPYAQQKPTQQPKDIQTKPDRELTFSDTITSNRLIEPSRNLGKPNKLILLTRKGDVFKHNRIYSLAPFFKKWQDILASLYPQGLYLHSAYENNLKVEDGDFFICFDAFERDEQLAISIAERCGVENCMLFHYENPIAYHHRKWCVKDSFWGLFKYVFSSAAQLTDGSKAWWIPLWNFLINFENGLPITQFEIRAQERHRKLAINPIGYGITVSSERVRIVDTVIEKFPDCAIFGKRSLYDSEPFLRWYSKYAGEIEVSALPYRFLNKIKVFSQYPFTLVIENAFTDGYISEKLGEPLAALSIPVYFGYPHIERYLPNLFPHAAINGHQYETMDALFDHLRHMSKEEYQLRVALIRQHRSDYFDLTSRVNIWAYALGHLFDIKKAYRNTVYENINEKLIELNSEPTRISQLNNVYKLLKTGAVGMDYHEPARELLFEPNRMPRTEFIGTTL